MKKAMMLAVMVSGMGLYAVAQDSPTLPEQSAKGQAIRTLTQGPETGKEKGQLISEAASENGRETSTAAKAKGEEQEPIGDNEPNEPIGDNEPNENATHGMNVKAVAQDETLSGREKGQAVKAVATANPKAQRAERPEREKIARAKRPERPERAARPERAKRPERARRPATAGRPSGVGPR